MSIKTFAATAMILGGLLAGACASPPKPELMALTTTTTTSGLAPATAGQPGFEKVRIGKIEGGGETNPAWNTSLSAKEFQTALEFSMRTFNYLAKDANGAAYDVAAKLEDINIPMMGIDMTTSLKVHYTVTPTAGGAAVINETVASSGTAKMGEAFMGAERIRRSVEYAVRNNIDIFLKKLSTTVK